MRHRYRAVFLDVGETLIGVVRPFEAYREALLALGLDHGLDAIAAADRAARAALATAGRRSPQPPDWMVAADEEHAWRDRLVRTFLTELGVAERFEEATQAIWDTWAGTRLFQRFPETLAFLDRLRAHDYVVGIVSNWDPRLERVLHAHELREWVDFVVCSEVEGYVKPSPRLFQRALTLAGVRPAEAIHVGDSYAADVEGARAVGIEAVWLDRGGRGERPFAPTVHALDEVLHVLGGQTPLRGSVTPDMQGDGVFAAGPAAQAAVERAVGFRPSPELLALRLARPADLAAWEQIRARPAASITLPDQGVAQLWSAVLSDGAPAAVLLRDAAARSADTVEVMAPAGALDSLPRADGDALTLFVGAAAE